MHFLAPQELWWAVLALAGALAVLVAIARQRQMLKGWYGNNADEVAENGGNSGAHRDNGEVPGGTFGSPLSRRRFVLKGAAVVLAVVAAAIALARPSMPHTHVEFAAGSVDVVVLLDVSRSMAARDCEGVSRINTARGIIREQIVPSLDRNRIGIVSYAGQAVPQVFLTYELDTVRWLTEHELKISSAPGQGSAMSEAFGLAFKYFDEDSDRSRRKMIVLLSDGGSDDKTNIAVIAENCRKRDIHLIVAGTGTTTPALIPVEELSEFDRRTATDRFYKLNGKQALTALEAGTLTELVGRCGSSATLVPVTSVNDFQFKPLASALKPQEKPGEKELFFYPALVFFLAVCLSVAATYRRA